MRRSRYRGRRRPTLDAKPRILILCEGIATEPNYFKALKADFGLSSVRVQRTGTLANMVKRVEREVAEDPTQDEIWCVLDHDERVTEIDGFRSWLQRPRSRTTTRIYLAISIPCFEYWLLLHFRFTTRGYPGAAGRSACWQVIQDLKRYLENYDKTDSSTYRRCRELLDTAIVRARRIPVNSASATGVGRLVERLRQL